MRTEEVPMPQADTHPRDHYGQMISMPLNGGIWGKVEHWMPELRLFDAPETLHVEDGAQISPFVWVQTGQQPIQVVVDQKSLFVDF